MADAAKTNAQTALTNAGTAKREAGDAKNALDPINRREEELQTAETALSKRAADLQVEIARSEARLAVDERQLVAIDAEFAVRERADAHRELFDDMGLARSMEQFSETPVFVEAAQTPEDVAFAKRLVFALGFSRAKITQIPPDHWVPRVGIRVEHLGRFTPAKAAAHNLCMELTKRGLDVSARMAPSMDTWNEAVPKDAILLRIGPRDTYLRHNRELLLMGAEPMPLNGESMTPEDLCWSP